MHRTRVAPRSISLRLVSALAAVTCVLAVTATGVADAATSSELAAAASHPGSFHALAPARALDTTAAATGTVSVALLGARGVPASGVGAVVLNVTVARPARGGYLTVYPYGSARPATSNLNFAAARTVANLVTVPLGTGGRVALYNASPGATRVVVDISGYYEAGTAVDAGAFHPLAPDRVLDTGSGLGAPSSSAVSKGTASVPVAGVAGVPSSGASAVVLNVTVATPQASGFATVYPSGSARPGTSTLNFPAGRTVPNLVVVKLGADGKVNLYNGSLGSVRFVADVFGYFLTGAPSEAGTLEPLVPTRIMDSRTGLGIAGALAAGATAKLKVGARGGLPTYGGGAVVLNVTVTGGKAGGYVTVWPTDATRPGTSNLNYTAGQTVANLVIVRPSETGYVSITNSSARAVHVIADASASYRPGPGIRFRGSEVIVPANVDPLPGDALAVDCPAENLCRVVTSKGEVVTRTGTGWSTPVDVTPGHALSAISCPTTTFCAVVGEGTVELFNGTSWSAPTAVDSSDSLTKISCASSLACVAISNYWTFFYDGTSWSGPIDNQSGLFSTDVSCPTATFCVFSTTEGEAITWDGIAFQAPVDTGVQEFEGISCLSSTFCVGVGQLGEFTVLTGAGWSAAKRIDTVGTIGQSFEGVSCRTTTFCVTGSSANVNAYTFDGDKWIRSATAPFEPWFVACASTSFCLAVSNNGASVGRPT